MTGTPGATVNLPHHMNLENTPVFQMALDDLFPFLKTNQLPLYMMKEQVSLELQFTPFNTNNSRRACIPYSSDDNNIGVDPDITQTELKLIADYLYYPQEMMTAYESSNQKMSFTYVDYRSMKRTREREMFTTSRSVASGHRYRDPETASQTSETNTSASMTQYDIGVENDDYLY